jgi:hypothetical protein
MSVEGLSRSAIARVEHLTRPTVDRWLDRASDAAQQFNDQLIRNMPLQELQADEIQTVALDNACPTWIFTTVQGGRGCGLQPSLAVAAVTMPTSCFRIPCLGAILLSCVS